MYTPLFWRDAGERAVSTMAQVLLTLMSVDGFNLADLNVKAVVFAALLAGLLSVLKAVVALNATNGNSASLTVDNVKEK